MLTRNGLFSRMVFHSSLCSRPWGQGSTEAGERPTGPRAAPTHRKRQEMLAAGMNAARLRHKEVIEAFTICLSSDICFLQALRAACQRMRYGPASRPALPGAALAPSPRPRPELPVWEGEIAPTAKGNKHEESSLDKKRVFLCSGAPLQARATRWGWG